ncbi:MAG: pyridoxamine 5'-phosphate oxidase family protein [Methanomicrobiaceae archaeon]|nr:pyridoxamine 5'-phosphate oxidase family protein [Methanomicrobiaceae archaeon]
MGCKITDPKEIEEILSESQYLRLGLCDDNKPYIVPMTFGYDNGVIYLHGSKTGRKMDIIRKNNKVCFEADKLYEIIPSENPCKYNMKYQSVVGFGTASIPEDENEKREGLKVIAAHYHKSEFDTAEMNVKGLAVIRIDIEEMQGRQNKME